MQYLKTYLKTISSRGNEKLAESISHTAEDVGNRYIKSFSFCSHEIGLLFGNVQSGKTGQMFGIMCKAADLGFPAFVLLTTDNVVLQQQTLDRVKADLTGFCVCGENDSGLFIENSLLQPAIVVLKKNYRVLKLWANVFASTGFMKGNPLFIIDDEADAASLNTLINRNRQSSINKYLDAIKNGASSSIYLQVLLKQFFCRLWHRAGTPILPIILSRVRLILVETFSFRRTRRPTASNFSKRLKSQSIKWLYDILLFPVRFLHQEGKLQTA